MANSDDLLWSDELGGDQRKKNKMVQESDVDLSKVQIHLRRLTSGKGRTVIELSNLPQNKKWCKKLTKGLQKSLGVGGAYKNDFIEIHGEQLDRITNYLIQEKIRFKKVGG